MKRLKFALVEFGTDFLQQQAIGSWVFILESTRLKITRLMTSSEPIPRSFVEPTIIRL